MKSRTIGVLIALSMALALSVFGGNLSAAGGPRLAIKSLEHSFGSVKPGTALRFTFEVKNEGEAALEIKSVSPSCGCTTSNFDKTVAPGMTGGITLAVEKTDGYKGEVVKTATVTTNDPDHQTFTLTVRANFLD